MNARIVLFSLCLSFYSNIAFGQNESESLVNTKWKFKGFVYKNKTSIEACRADVVYYIEFRPKGVLIGEATVTYRGRYKIKNGSLKIRTFIPKGVPPTGGVHGELECRVNYGKYLVLGGRFIQSGQYLKIASSEYVSLMFEIVN